MSFRAFLLFVFLFNSEFAWSYSAAVHEEVPVVYRGPSAEHTVETLKTFGRVLSFEDSQTLKMISEYSSWLVGETVAVESQNTKLGILAFLEIKSVVALPDGTYEVICSLVRQSRVALIQPGDYVVHLDLSSKNEKYIGTTDLIVKKGQKDVSARFKPLVTQGLAVGDTAETLWKDEYLVTWYGHLYYGWEEDTTFSAVLPVYLLGAFNGTVKHKFFESTSNIFANGLSFVRIPDEDRSTLNLNLYWDSISSDSVLSHTFLTISLLSFSEAEDNMAIKSVGTSSFQTGYEFILSNWDRVLMGPSYNFEAEAVGGYLSYVKVWDNFHAAAALSSTDITDLTFFGKSGYYFMFDAYWRY